MATINVSVPVTNSLCVLPFYSQDGSRDLNLFAVFKRFLQSGTEETARYHIPDSLLQSRPIPIRNIHNNEISPDIKGPLPAYFLLKYFIYVLFLKLFLHLMSFSKKLFSKRIYYTFPLKILRFKSFTAMNDTHSSVEKIFDSSIFYGSFNDGVMIVMLDN